MKKLVLTSILTLLCLSAILAEEKTYDASSPYITYVGRTLKKDNSVSFDWTGTYLKIRFRGAGIAMRISDTGKNYYNLWIDKDSGCPADKVLMTTGKDSLIVLFSKTEMYKMFGKNDRKEHEILLQKRTEGREGITTIHSFVVEGELRQASPVKDRVIEFIGDSYTCGYGTENSIATDPFKAETENSNFSYANVLSRYFGADCIILAHSGVGVSRNYGDKSKDYNIGERYEQTFDTRKDILWKTELSDIKPDITVIYMGDNDFSSERQPSLKSFMRKYTELLKKIKENYGEDYPILCMASNADDMLFYYIQETVKASGMKNIGYMSFTHYIHNQTDELGANYHTNRKGHIKKAYGVIPYISTLTGWEMNENIIK